MVDYERPNKVTVYDDGEYRVVLRLRNNHPGFCPWALCGYTEVAKYAGEYEFKGKYSDQPGGYQIPARVLKALKKAWKDCERGVYDAEYRKHKAASIVNITSVSSPVAPPA